MAEIAVIGGINIDIEGKPFGELMRADSNPGRIMISYGGVGRNITENLCRMGADVAMLSVIGDDYMGNGAKQELATLGADVTHITSRPGQETAMYLSILNERNDMELGICDMDIVDTITPEFIEENIEVLSKAKVVALDGNLSEETLAYATQRLEGTPLFFDPVSSPKALKARKVIGKFACIKPNIMEAEILSGMKIKSLDDVKKAGAWFVSQGVGKVFITLNKDGVYYKDEAEEGFLRPSITEMESATGAGDSFSAAILFGMTKGWATKEIATMGMAAAAITMESRSAVNDNICMEEIERRMKNV